MVNKKTRIMIFCYLLLVLGSSLTVLNMGLPSKMAEWYSRGEIGLLKNLSLANEEPTRPPDYYTGRIEDVWVGPLTSVISGGLFLLFCLWFLQGAGSLKFAVATFLYLLLSRPQVLFYPPYGDALFAVLSEPLWLVRHHLDWIGMFQQKTFVLGGPLQYPESIYPRFIALLMYFSPSPKVFLLTNHLIVFAAGAALVATLRKILLEFCDAKRATLGAFLFLALPIIQCHFELLNMELVCTCFAAACLLRVLRKDFFMAGAMAIFAAMVKVSGAITAPVLLGACLLSFFNEPDKKKYAGNIAWVFGACSIIFYLWALRQGTVAQPGLSDRGPLANADLLLPLPLTWFFLFLSVLYLGRCVAWWVSSREKGGGLFSFFNDHYKSLAIFGMGATWNFSVFHAPAMIPRYTVLAIPFVLLFFVYLFSAFVKKDVLFSRSMIAMILFAFLGSHGLLFVNQKTTGDVNINERSLEYRNVLKVYRRAAKEVERNCSDFAMVGNILIAQILAFKEAGYVSRSTKNVFVYGSGATHEGIGALDRLAESKISKVIYIAETSEDPYYLSGFPIGPSDRIVKEIWAGDKRMTFFTGGFAIHDWLIEAAVSYKEHRALAPTFQTGKDV